MVSKRLKGAQEEGEGPSEEGAGLEEGPSSKKFRKQRRKTQEEEEGLVRVDDMTCSIGVLYPSYVWYRC